MGEVGMMPVVYVNDSITERVETKHWRRLQRSTSRTYIELTTRPPSTRYQHDPRSESVATDFWL